MKIRYYLFGLAFALILASGALHVDAQEAEDLSNTELHQLILDLTDEIEELRADLDTANDKIAELEEDLANVDTSGDDDDDDDDDDGEENTYRVQTKTQAKNGVAVCHQGRTMYVSVNSALNYKKNGAKIGLCDGWVTPDSDDDDDSVSGDDDDDDDDDDDSTE